MNLADIIILLLVAVAVGFAIRTIIHTRKHGNSCCGGGGSCCGSCSTCQNKGCKKYH